MHAPRPHVDVRIHFRKHWWKDTEIFEGVEEIENSSPDKPEGGPATFLKA